MTRPVGPGWGRHRLAGRQPWNVTRSGAGGRSERERRRDGPWWSLDGGRGAGVDGLLYRIARRILDWREERRDRPPPRPAPRRRKGVPFLEVGVRRVIALPVPPIPWRPLEVRLRCARRERPITAWADRASLVWCHWRDHWVPPGHLVTAHTCVHCRRERDQEQRRRSRASRRSRSAAAPSPRSRSA